MPLIDATNSYDIVYNWFKVLKEKAVDVVGFVIMPNHLHCILHFREKEFSVNDVISNGKRFMAYEIINRLEREQNMEVLDTLHQAVTERERRKGQRHKVFKDSFDAKPIFSDKFMEQKLSYTHYNPVSGKWQLVTDYAQYEHSSASFYELGISKHFTPVHFKDL
jgi:REP element-mobilizing transposase RayT